MSKTVIDSLLGLIKRKALLVLFFSVSAYTPFALSAIDISKTEIQRFQRFTTWQGIEPDKWATLWLIKRYIVPDAYFFLVPPNTNLPENALPFGVPDVAIRRANRESMFHRLKQAVNIDSPDIKYLDKIIHDVEVNIWDEPAHPHSHWFETLYRTLQARYKRDQVPVDCYLAFFDGVARLAKQADITAEDYRDQLSLTTLCPGLPKEKPTLVQSLGYTDVLREVSLGKRVVFLDTRESEEFEEVHLPGAKLLRLRDVNKNNVKSLLEADLVVPYCVKDFRGFEVAKALKQYGVERVATLSPSGLKGWLNAGLPVVGKNKMNEKEATEKLMQCAMEPSSCILLSAKVFP